MKNNKEILEEYAKFRKTNNMADNTVIADLNAVKRLLQYTEKNISKINEEDTINFISSFNNITTKSQYATKLIIFFRWFYKLDKKERPNFLVWYEYPSTDQLAKRKDPDTKKYLITKEIYQKIIQFCGAEGKWSALFETLYLSGGRRNEINDMEIKDVEIDKNNKVTITLRTSKTIPRKVPLSETPHMLIRWLAYHPFRDNPEAPLFPSFDHAKYKNHMIPRSINGKFKTMRDYLKLNKALTPHCFRKTRATIMFSSRDPIFDDREIGAFFGWKAHTVVDRRQQYDLRDFDDLKEKIQGTTKVKLDTYDVIKQERDALEGKYQNEIEELKKGMSDLKDQQAKKTEIDDFADDALKLIVKEIIQKEGIEWIKEVLKKHNVPLVKD